MGMGIDNDLDGNRSLRDEFAIPEDDANDIATALYKEEMNGRKIAKLGNRLTTICILLPSLTCAILVYGYLDIKERVMVINDSGQTQVDVMTKEFEAKINNLEVELAKIKFVLEKDIPELKQQAIAIQDELTLLAGTKSDKEETDRNLELIKASVDKVADQYQGALHILDGTNQETLAIINKKSKDIESSMEASIASVKTIEADIKSNVASLVNIDSKIDSRVDSVLNKRIDSSIDKRVKAIINERLSAHSQNLDKKIADIDLSVESRLATLQEATQILAENKTSISKLEKGFGELDKSVVMLDKELKNYHATTEKSINLTNDTDKKKPDIDKKYVDSQINTLKKNLNDKIDQLNLNLSRKILQYTIQLESSAKSKNPGIKKKTDDTREVDSNRATEVKEQKDKSAHLLKEPERGKISETDLPE